MAFTLHVVKSDLLATAQSLNVSVNEFITATDKTRIAAETVLAAWQGDARNAFAAEQEKNIQTYQQMARHMQDYIKAINDAQNAYTDTDANCARLLRSK